jgi:hypothetical protein
MKSMLLKDYFNKLANIFDDFFGNPDLNLDNIKTENQEWINFYYKNPLFRHVHLEYYCTNKIEVIHVNHFPNPLTNLPIFGLDVIVLGNKITGFFMDFTHMTGNYPALDSLLISLKNTFVLSQERKLPEWADIFSKNFICVVPDQEEVKKLFSDSLSVTKDYLEYVRRYIVTYEQNIFLQNKYCKGQKKNQKTLKALSVDIGEEKAKSFMENNLFPEIG